MKIRDRGGQMSTKVMIADDNRDIVDILSLYMKRAGYDVTWAADGEEAMSLFESESPDIILLDVMMPKKDGFDVCIEIRRSSDVPIIMVTARTEDSDKIMGLEIGADDYIVKPFNPSEIVARIKAILRRVEKTSPGHRSVVTLKGLSIDMDSNEVRLGGREINLTRKELDMLYLMASNPNKVFSRDNLLSSVWGYDYYGDSRTVDTHMTRLRAKLDREEHHDWDIKTVWGIGYKIEVRHD
jgi:two-component system, OmpR family, response regulator ResD